MRNRTLLAIGLGSTVILGIVAYLMLSSGVAHDAPTPPSGPATSQPDTTVARDTGLPVRLMIPSLEVDAKILYMGLTADGDMEVADNNFKDVGWYQYGARPGNEGTAVIAGHVNGVKERGVFIELHKIKVGDSVMVLDDKNQTSSFRVREIRTYDQNDRPEDVFHSDGGTHLNLITCAGSWDVAAQRFPDRLVVFTDKMTQ